MSRKPHRPHPLSHGRPPLARGPTPTLSSRATRTIIRTHHRTAAAASAASAAGDDARAARLRAAIDLPRYQAASLLGQRPERGGDASRVLVGWLRRGRGRKGKGKGNVGGGEGGEGVAEGDAEEGGEEGGEAQTRAEGWVGEGRRMLDVGALSTRNAAARAGLFERVDRIDLHAQAPGITKQDFLERPVPEDGDEGRYDVLGMSLVLNYAPDAATRGDMLRHATRFLRRRREEGGDGAGDAGPFPCLFLVLPLPCVANSRYFDDVRLGEIMARLGFTLLQRKRTNKLAYYLWRWEGEDAMDDTGPAIGKALAPGAESKGGMNNFRIELRSRDSTAA